MVTIKLTVILFFQSFIRCLFPWRMEVKQLQMLTDFSNVSQVQVNCV